MDAAELWSLESDLLDFENDDEDHDDHSCAEGDSSDGEALAHHNQPSPVVKESHFFDDKDPRKALYIPDLLFLVLDYLDYPDLLACHSVCTYWNHVLTNGYPGYRSFMKAIPMAPFVVIESKRGISMAKFETLREKWNNSLSLDSICEKESCKDMYQHRVLDAKYINPVFSRLALLDTNNTCLRVQGHCAVFAVFDSSDIQGLLDLHEKSKSSPSSSWRKMFLTNPPVKMFKAYSDIPGDRIWDCEGVKMGDVVEYLVHMVAREKINGGDWVEKRRARILSS